MAPGGRERRWNHGWPEPDATFCCSVADGFSCPQTRRAPPQVSTCVRSLMSRIRILALLALCLTSGSVRGRRRATIFRHLRPHLEKGGTRMLSRQPRPAENGTLSTPRRGSSSSSGSPDGAPPSCIRGRDDSRGRQRLYWLAVRAPVPALRSEHRLNPVAVEYEDINEASRTRRKSWSGRHSA